MWLRRTNSLPYFESLRRRRSHKSPWFLSSFSSSSDTPKKKPKHAPLQERRMVDRFRILAKGGDGGNGCSSFRRSRQDRRGKPDGGDGGRGGDVILECSPAVWDFSGLQHHVNAKRGGHGSSKNMIGSRGTDKVVQVPVGTVIHLAEGEIPSVVENYSKTALDPWDIPGTLDANPTEYEQQTTTDMLGATEVVGSNDGLSNIEKHNKKAPRMQQTVRDLSAQFHSQSFCFSEKKSITNMEESVFYSGDEENKGEDIKTDGVMSEVEEEEEEEEAIQYNVAELTEPGQRVLVATGGEGGLGNTSLGKVSKTHKNIKHGTPIDAAPDLDVSDDDQSSVAAGLPGSVALLVVELKSIADVGLVGIPNAGKSTLLGAISRAKPTVGHYAFTTLRPNIGNLNYDDFSFTVADIPGLIKGAHENRGLGHAFLRHIERTKVLAYVVDLAAALEGRKGIPPWEQLSDLILELEFHQKGLSGRPSLVVANKIDEEGAEDVYEELKRRVRGVPIFPVCAVLEEGIAELKAGLRELVDGGVGESQRLQLDGIKLN